MSKQDELSKAMSLAVVDTDSGAKALSKLSSFEQEWTMSFAKSLDEKKAFQEACAAVGIKYSKKLYESKVGLLTRSAKVNRALVEIKKLNENVLSLKLQKDTEELQVAAKKSMDKSDLIAILEQDIQDISKAIQYAEEKNIGKLMNTKLSMVKQLNDIRDQVTKELQRFHDMSSTDKEKTIVRAGHIQINIGDTGPKPKVVDLDSQDVVASVNEIDDDEIHDIE